MNFAENIKPRADWLKGHDLASRTMEGPNTGEESLVPAVNTTLNSESSERDAASEERDAKLELWMEDIKTFIRNIDVNNL
ncbi:hypothetical protein [Desulfoferrobacter suflitae]|uniref:hypothetical protein n=1 Tax=Desulfoferrobacter suflitae TaxID=2865782 RepID=UPI0021643E9D|nr:hypothetical protein [Desulfoferrobacter suflitae]MCK8602726.1 hypothetical protein [Desulfoferrobacter suflitae]